MNTKLKKLGQKLGMDEIDIMKAKRTMKNKAFLYVAIGIVAIVGLISMNRMDPMGLYYMPDSINDFNFFTRFF